MSGIGVATGFLVFDLTYFILNKFGELYKHRNDWRKGETC